MKRPLSILLSIFVATAVIGLGFRIALALNYIDFSGADTQDIRWPAGQTLSFVQGGSERLRIDATTGNVVIPQGLTVSGTFSMTGTYTGSVSAGNISAGDFGSNYGGGNFSFPGNVGIGTMGPVDDLNIAGTIGVRVALSDTDVNAAGENWYLQSGGGNFFIGQSTDADGSYTTLSDKLTILNGGNVGIGTTSPSDPLTVRGSDGTPKGILLSSVNDNTMRFWMTNTGTPSSGDGHITVANSADLILQETGGNVGIGTTSPGAKLDIKGNTDSFGGMAKIYLTDSNANAASRNWSIGNGGSAYGNLTFAVSAAKDGVAGDGTATNVMVLQSNGNVGIGTTSPGARLDIDGKLQLYGGGGGWSYIIPADKISVGGSGVIYLGTGNVGIGTTSPFYKLTVSGGNIGLDNDFFIASKDSGGTYRSILWLDSSNRLNLYNQAGNIYLGPNNVGIGTAGPTFSGSSIGGPGGVELSNSAPVYRITRTGGGARSYGLEVDSNGAFYINDNTAGAGNQRFRIGTDGSVGIGGSGAYGVYVLSGGNVGIGTTAPSEKLHISTPSGSHNRPVVESLGAGDSAAWRFKTPDNEWIAGINTATPAAGDGDFSIGDISASAARLVIKKTTGNVGIGTTSPATKLHVVGGDYNSGIRIESSDVYGSGVGFKNTSAGGRHFNIFSTGSANGEGAGKLAFLDVAVGTRMLIDGSGNVGIGYTDTSGNKLAVNGAIYSSSSITAATQFCFPGDCRSSWASVAGGAWTLSGNNLYPNSTTYNVGIGTTSPGGLLHLRDDVGTSIRFEDSTDGVFGEIGNGVQQLGTGTIDYLAVMGNAGLYLGTGSTAHMTINGSTGNVGIGTTGPNKKLHILDTSDGNLVYGLKLENGAAPETANTATGILFAAGDTATNPRGKGGLIYNLPSGSVWGKGDFHFLQNTAVSATNAGLSDSVMVIKNNGNVGIGTTAPGTKLDIRGNIFVGDPGVTHAVISSADGLYFNSDRNNSGVSTGIVFGRDRTGTGGGTTDMVIDGQNGNVGIGTTSPGRELEISSANPDLQFIETGVAADNGVWLYGADDGTFWGQIINDAENTATTFLQVERTGMTVDSFNIPTGNVGIGTTAPVTKLEVVSNTPPNLWSMGQLDVRTQEVVAANKGAMISIGGNSIGNNTPYNFGVIGAYKTNSTSGDFSSYMIFGTSDVYSNVLERMRIDASGNVGIGYTDTSGNKLAVNGAIYSSSSITAATQFCFPGDCRSSWASVAGGAWTLSGNNLYPNSTSYNVGIGTAADSGTDYSNNKLFMTGEVHMVSQGAHVWFGDSTIGNPIGFGEGLVNSLGADQDFLSAYYRNSLRFFSNGAIERMRIDVNGNVGIGTTSPGAPLHVVTPNTSGMKKVIFQTSTVDNGMSIGLYATKTHAAQRQWEIASNSILGGDLTFLVSSAYNNEPTYTAADTVLQLTKSGNVGIGTSTPGSNLDIQGVSTTGLFFGASNSGARSGIIDFGSGNVQYGYNRTVADAQQNVATYSWASVLGSQGIDSVQFSRKPAGGAWSTLFKIQNDGNVGIGTTNPHSLLEVSSSAPQLHINDVNGTASSDSTGYIVFTHGTTGTAHSSIQMENGLMGFDTAGAGNFAFTGGNVGIGYTDTSGNKLAVNGTTYSTMVNTPSLCIAGDCKTAWNQVGGPWTTSGSNIYYNSGNVGIGTTGPSNKLHIMGSVVSGSAVDSNAYLRVENNGQTDITIVSNPASKGILSFIDNSGAYPGEINYDHSNDAMSFLTNGSEKVRITSGGNVGIGTTSPGYKLHILQGAPLTPMLKIEATANNPVGATWTNTQGSVSVGVADSVGGIIVGDSYNATSGALGGSMAILTSGAKALHLGTNSSVNMTVASGGNVGIGTTAPKKLLHVNGTGAIESGQATTITDATVALKLGPSGGRTWSGYYMAGIGFANLWDYGGGTTYDANNHAWIGTYHESTPGSELAALVFATNPNTDNVGLPAERMRITSAGNVGIGYTDTSGNKLAVNGAIYSPTSITAGTQLCIGASCQSSWPGSQWTTSGANIYNSNSGNVGIGTTGPVALLTLNAGASGGDYTKGLQISRNGDNSSGGLRVWHTDSGNTSEYFDSMYDNAASSINFRTRVLGTPVNAMTILGSGNVGIGTTNPQYKLQINTSSNLTFLLTGLSPFPQVPTIYQSIGASVVTNSTDSVVGLNLENTSQTNNTYSPLITFSRKSSSGSYNSTYAAIAGLATGVGHDTNWMAGDLTFWTAGLGITSQGPQERLRITGSGNVGIGTTSPTAKLHVIGNDNQIAVDTVSEGAAGIFLRQAGVNQWELYDWNNAFHLFNYGTSADAITVLQSNGNVGIGTTGPGYKLDVQGGAINVSGEMYRNGQSLDSRYSRKDTTGQWLKPYYEYGSWLTTEVPSTLTSQMGGGGLRVDFLYPSYTANGDWGHVLTWSGYDRYGMWQLSGSYYDSDPRLFFRHDATHTNAWTSWYEVLNSSRHAYAANMNQYVRTSDGPTFSGVYSNNWFRSYGTTGWYNETYGIGLRAEDSTWLRAYPASTYFRAQYIYQDGPAGYVSSINGSFTSGYVPRADGSYRLTNGTIYDDGTNVGIGTTSPGSSYKLDVQGGSGAAIQAVGGTGGGVRAISSTSSTGVYGQSSLGYGVYGSSGGTAVFSAGVYGYSTATSGTVFGVYGLTESTSGFGVQAYSNTSGYRVRLAGDTYLIHVGTTLSDRFWVSGTAAYFLKKVGIGRTPSTNMLEVEGGASKTTSGSWLANSDLRIKKDIVPAGGLKLLSRLNPVAFRYTDEYRAMHPAIEDKVYYNFIAQEFAEVFPDFIKGSGEFLPNGREILQIDPYPAQVVAIKAIKELASSASGQQKQIESLLAMMGRFTIDENGTLTVKKVVTDELELGGYCVKVKEGKLEAEKGECE